MRGQKVTIFEKKLKFLKNPSGNSFYSRIMEVLFACFWFFSEGIWPAPITNKSYLESLLGKTAK